MKRLRVRATPDPDVAPRAFQLLADAPTIEETRLLEWNLGSEDGPTMLFSVNGDHAGLDAALLDEGPIARAEVTAVDTDRAVLLVTLRPDASPLAAAMFEALARSGVVVDMPVVYREGTVHATLVGEASTLQAVLDAFPASVSVDIREVGEFGGDDPTTALSDRQREAVVAGLALGYYDVPRRATHADLAERLGCAPSTASEHLQKAESKLVKGSMGAATAAVPSARRGAIRSS